MIGGKPATIIGDKHSNLILQGSSVKIQWGNKFIDVIKNGKIASEEVKFIYQISSEDEIKQDGIYILNDELWVVIGDKHIKLGSESYISYIQEQKLTEDQQYTALKNLGFYYDTLEEAQSAKNGIVYIADTQKLYLVNNGTLTEYSTTVYDSGPENDNILLQNLYINENSLMVDNNIYLTCINEQIISERNVYLKKNLYSYPYSKSQGFAIYTENNQSYLEIDHVNERYGEKNKFDKTAYTQYNTITNCEPINDNLKLTLLYDNKFESGDYVFLISKNQFETITNKQGYITEIKFKYPLNTDLELSYINQYNYNTNITINSNSNTYNFNPYAKSFDISFEYELFQFKVISVSNKTIEVPFDENIALNKYVYIAKSNSKPIPYIYNNDNSFEVYDDAHKLNTIIGYNSHLNSTGLFSSNTVFTSREEYNEEYQTEYTKTSGEYSNAFWANIFKFPTYSVKLAQELKDVINFKNSGESNKNDFIQTQMRNVSEGSIVPTIDVVKTIINSIIPKGTIVMWSGNQIPNGWVICDGNGDTPDLRNKFILGGNRESVNETGNYKYISSISISTAKNGDHDHTINELTTDKAGSHSHRINFDNTTTGSIPYYKLIYIMKNV